MIYIWAQMPQCNIKKPLQRPLALFSQSLGPGPVWTQITLDKLQISAWSHVNKVAHVFHIIYICLCYSIYYQQVSCFSLQSLLKTIGRIMSHVWES